MGLVKDSQRSLDRRLPVEQGGRKPPGEAAAAADDDKLTPSGQTQMAQWDSSKGKQGEWKDERERENCVLAVDRNQ